MPIEKNTAEASPTLSTHAHNVVESSSDLSMEHDNLDPESQQSLNPHESQQPLNSESQEPLNSESQEPLNSESQEPLNSESQEPLNSESQEPPYNGLQITNFIFAKILEWLCYIYTDIPLQFWSSIFFLHIEENESDSDSNDNENTESTQQYNEQIIKNLHFYVKYLPFLLIFSLKIIFDHTFELSIFICFCYFNKIVESEVAKSKKCIKNKFSMISICSLIIISILVFSYFIIEVNLRTELIYNSYKYAVSMSYIFCSLFIIDHVLKLITIIIKLAVLMTPMTNLKQGTVFVYIEITSQFYRYFMPIRPWLYYFFKSYRNWYYFGLFFSILYLIIKGKEFIDCVKIWLKASNDLYFNLFETRPSKEQLMEAGTECSICLDYWRNPIILQCKHIYCENCLTNWLDRKNSCPLCNGVIINNDMWQNGTTTKFIQVF